LLHECRVRLILLRSAGFNHVDIGKARAFGIKVMRVPGYSPEAVAEHAMALALAANRRIHKAYVRVRENDFSLGGMLGFNFYRKTAGIVGTGKIGAAMARICHGFGMDVLAYDKYQNPELDFAEYVSMDELLGRSELVSLHCPLTEETYHLICRETIQKMKDGVVLVNTSRGGLVKTEDLIEGIRARKFFAVGLDVYEEEKRNVYEDRSDEILESSVTSRLLSFPNVLITSHQGFFTEEALGAISETTLKNAAAFSRGETTGNEVE
jgi:D-lactate dehydrogenase